MVNSHLSLIRNSYFLRYSEDGIDDLSCTSLLQLNGLSFLLNFWLPNLLRCYVYFLPMDCQNRVLLLDQCIQIHSYL